MTISSISLLSTKMTWYEINQLEAFLFLGKSSTRGDKEKTNKKSWIICAFSIFNYKENQDKSEL